MKQNFTVADLKRLPAITLVVAAIALSLAVSAFHRHRHGASNLPSAGSKSNKALTIPEMLQDINQHQDSEGNVFLNSARAQHLRNALSGQGLSQVDTVNMEVGYATELTNSGKASDAISLFNMITQTLHTAPPEAWAQIGPIILKQQAIAYLRLGEMQNCCSVNNAQSCLIPIRGAGIHTKKEGSLGAIKNLTALLKMQPEDMSARWLLNIAYMTVGEYPGRVPAKWLVPLSKLGNEYPMQPFHNAAPELGLDYFGLAGSVIMEDFEGNGLLDLMISTFDLNGPMRYVHNNGDGTFTDRSDQTGLAGEVGGSNLITTDYNNDGKPDIVVLRGGWLGKSGHYPLSLLRNDGNGHFTDVTIKAGLLSKGPTQTAVAFDYNGDGLLDLFVGYESTKGDPITCKLFRNNGDGTFTDVTKQCGLNITKFVKSVISADFMHSGRPGLYLSCGNGPNILLRNDGPAGADKSPTAPWKFTDISQSAGVDKQAASFSCFFFDYDNDGWPDIYVGGYSLVDVGEIAKDYLGMPSLAPKAKLYRNNHNGTFTDVTRQAHLDKVVLGMGINYGDLDNDGWLDFYSGTGNPDLGMLIPKRMFRNHNGAYFDEVTTTGDFGHLQKGHGIAFGDLNNNGQQDVFIVLGGAFEGDTAHDALFVNPGNRNHWVNLSLSGVKSNRIALGAEICVIVATPHGDRKIYKTVSTGGSFGNNPLRQAVGLGDATAIKQVDIHWPTTGINQTLRNLTMDRFYKVSEGVASPAQAWSVPQFKLKSKTSPNGS